MQKRSPNALLRDLTANDSRFSRPAIQHHKLIAGGLIVRGRPEAVLGYAYDYDKHWRFQVDYQSGRENFFTLGFTWSLNDEFQINPAIYFSNDHPDNVSGYIVFTYTFHLWKAGK